MEPLCSIFFHNYYGHHEYWLDFFSKNLSVPYNLYYNTVEDSIYNLRDRENDVSSTFTAAASDNISKIIYRRSPNKGKDIGGKLILLDAYQRLGNTTEYGLLLHDKKSPYKANTTTWANDLLRIAHPDFSKDAVKLFTRKPEVGIITSSGNIRNEYNSAAKSFVSTNKLLLPGLQNIYNIFPASFHYVAGTMFWFRIQPVNNFFKKYPPLTIRKMLETGNVTDDHAGSYTHSWERLLCWIVSAQKYKIEII